MKRRNKILLTILALLVIAAVFLFLFRNAIVSYIVPTLTTDTIKVDVRDDTAYVSTRFYATSKSFVPLKIDSIKYKIELFDKVYVREETYLGIDLKAYDKDTFDFALKIPSTQLMNDLAEKRKTSKHANYSIYVALQFSTLFGSIELPINKKSNFKIPTPPEIKVAEVNYTEIKLDHMLAEVKVKVHNFNQMNLTLQSLDYTLSVPGEGVASGSYNDSVVIKPQSEIFVDLPVTVKWFHIAGTLADLIQDKDIYNYLLTCNAVILTPGKEPKPIVVHITKHGILELKKEQTNPKIEKIDEAVDNFFEKQKEKKEEKKEEKQK